MAFERRLSGPESPVHDGSHAGAATLDRQRYGRSKESEQRRHKETERQDVEGLQRDDLANKEDSVKAMDPAARSYRLGHSPATHSTGAGLQFPKTKARKNVREALRTGWSALLVGSPSRTWMRWTERRAEYDAPFVDVALVYYNRFLSPYNAHVVSSDTVARAFDPTTLALHSCRLQRKSRKSMPKWLPGRLAAIRDTWVLESSVIDPTGRVLYSASRNLDHRTNADGIEWQEFAEHSEISVSSATTFSIVSATASGTAIGPWVQSQLEAAFIAGFRVSAEKTRSNYDFLLSVLGDGKLRRQFLFGYQDPGFSRVVPLRQTAAHAEGLLAGFSGHGVHNGDHSRYDQVELQRARRSWFVFDLRWQKRLALDADGVPDAPRPSLQSWVRGRLARWRSPQQHARDNATADDG